MTTSAVPFSATVRVRVDEADVAALDLCHCCARASLLAVATSAAAWIAVGVTWDDWSAAERAEFDPILFPLVGAVLTGIALPLIGVKSVSSEYSSGMIRLTLTATPRRGRLLLAKALAVAAVTLIAGSIAVIAMFLTGQAIYASYGLDTASPFELDVLRTLAATGAMFTVFPVLAVALAVQLRSAAATITAVLALVFVPAVVGALLPSWFQDHVVAYLPAPATDSVSISHLEGADAQLSAGVALVVLVGWLAAFLIAAHVVLEKRDA